MKNTVIGKIVEEQQQLHDIIAQLQALQHHLQSAPPEQHQAIQTAITGLQQTLQQMIKRELI